MVFYGTEEQPGYAGPSPPNNALLESVLGTEDIGGNRLDKGDTRHDRQRTTTEGGSQFVAAGQTTSGCHSTGNSSYLCLGLSLILVLFNLLPTLQSSCSNCVHLIGTRPGAQYFYKTDVAHNTEPQVRWASAHLLRVT